MRLKYLILLFCLTLIGCSQQSKEPVSASFKEVDMKDSSETKIKETDKELLIKQSVLKFFDVMTKEDFSHLKYFDVKQKEELKKFAFEILPFRPASAIKEGYSFEFDDKFFVYEQIDNFVKFNIGVKIINPDGDILQFYTMDAGFIEENGDYLYCGNPHIISQKYYDLAEETASNLNQKVYNNKELYDYMNWALNVYNKTYTSEFNEFIEKY